MKKLFLTGIGFFLAMSLTFAQQITPEETATKVVTELTQKLTLNDEQQASVSTIVLDHTKAVDAIINDATVTPETKVEAANKLQTEADAKINALLTDEQKTAYQQIIAERPAIAVPAAPVEQTESTNEQTESKEESNNNLGENTQE